MRFSGRVPDDLRPNRLALARRRLGEPAFDLTLSNPTRAGFDLPGDLLSCLAHPRGRTYRPEPRGPLAARDAVAAELARWGGAVEADRIVLTASTSEAYGMLFKLLCDPGERVLVPTPSYPLLEDIARCEGVATAAFALRPETGWGPDLADLERAPSDVRAVVLVHPNNPTGSHVAPADAAAVDEVCRRRGWAQVVDEVFLPYPLDDPGERSLARPGPGLRFTLGGLSKRAGLPQVKLGWIAVTGDDRTVARALERLDWIADAALSVATPAAEAAADLLAASEPLRATIRRRCASNLAALRGLVAAQPSMSVPAVGGGWSAPVRFPAVVSDEALALDLLERDGVAVHPGYLFDMPADGWLVVSLLAPEEAFAEGARRMVGRVATLLG